MSKECTLQVAGIQEYSIINSREYTRIIQTHDCFSPSHKTFCQWIGVWNKVNSWI